MRIATYRRDGRREVGLVSADGSAITPLALAASQMKNGALHAIERVVAGARLPLRRHQPIPIGAVTLEAPLPLPRRNLFCVGRNYRAHAQELSASVFQNNATEHDMWPIVFSKVPESVVGPGADVELPPREVSTRIDYEAELAVVIGKGGRHIARSEAMDHVFGYTIVNDVTARDVQMRHQQWDLGKSFDTFCPMGPWIVSADEFDGTNARVRCWVNGELRQDDSTAHLIFDIATLVETCSRGITLYPGDIVATGTPSGVGMGMKPPRYLQAGDVVRIEIDRLGVLENRFVSATKMTPVQQPSHPQMETQHRD